MFAINHQNVSSNQVSVATVRVRVRVGCVCISVLLCRVALHVVQDENKMPMEEWRWFFFGRKNEKMLQIQLLAAWILELLLLLLQAFMWLSLHLADTQCNNRCLCTNTRPQWLLRSICKQTQKFCFYKQKIETTHTREDSNRNNRNARLQH